MSADRWNAFLYDDRHRFVFEYGRDLLALLDARGGERILDVGCGTGHLTQAIAATGASVTGLDASDAMIAQARAEHPGIDFVVADATGFDLGEQFDAVFSNAALHWIRDADAAARCMAAALRPRGRFVVEFGGRGNLRHLIGAVHEALVDVTGHDMDDGWYFPSIAEYSTVLEHHGIEVTQAALFDRPTPLEGDDGLRTWIVMFCANLLGRHDEAARARVLDRSEALLRDTMYAGGRWTADYRRLRICGRKTG